MSTILIDRRTAALLGEMAAAAPAASKAGRPSKEGVTLGLGVAPARPARSAGQRMSGTGAAGNTTRPARKPGSTDSGRPAAVTVRRDGGGDSRLRGRLRCSAVVVARPVPPKAVAATQRQQPVRSASPSLHLTRRGRLVALLLLFIVLTVAFSVGRVTSTALGAPNAPGAEAVVHQGDTLWSIAERIAPNRDPRATAADLMAVNGLGSPSLEVGQHLRLP